MRNGDRSQSQNNRSQSSQNTFTPPQEDNVTWVCFYVHGLNAGDIRFEGTKAEVEAALMKEYPEMILPSIIDYTYADDLTDEELTAVHHKVQQQEYYLNMYNEGDDMAVIPYRKHKGCLRLDGDTECCYNPMKPRAQSLDAPQRRIVKQTTQPTQDGQLHAKTTVENWVCHPFCYWREKDRSKLYPPTNAIDVR